MGWSLATNPAGVRDISFERRVTCTVFPFPCTIYKYARAVVDSGSLQSLIKTFGLFRVLYIYISGIPSVGGVRGPGRKTAKENTMGIHSNVEVKLHVPSVRS